MLLGRLSEAQPDFQEAFSLREGLPDGGAKLYDAWSTMTLAHGLDAPRSEDFRAFKEVGLMYIDILEKAQQDGMSQIVEDARMECERQLEAEVEQGLVAETEREAIDIEILARFLRASV